MTPALLAGIVGLILSLLFAYTPGLKERFDALAAPDKARVMGGMLVLASIVIAALSCSNAVSIVPCTEAGLRELGLALLQALLVAGGVNQAAYMLLVEPFKKPDDYALAQALGRLLVIADGPADKGPVVMPAASVTTTLDAAAAG